MGLKQALAVLRDGGIVCFPTESSYGLAVDPRNTAALEALVRLKGRKQDASAPFALVAASIEQARECTGAWPHEAERLAATHWPGALTLIVPGGGAIGKPCLGAGVRVGVRVSSVPWARELPRTFGYPLTATSANPRGAPPATSRADAKKYFSSQVGAYLDGGLCGGEASTMVAFDDFGRAQVLREGPIVLPPRDGP